MKQIFNFVTRYKSFVTYTVFGVLTTLVNIIVYNLCYNGVGISNTCSNVIAWVLAVSFAYFTNKVWVFESKSWELNVLKKEVPAFISCRFVTGIVDVLIMYVSIDIMNYHAMLMKIISNVFIIVLNYIFSKLVIFRKKIG